MKHLICRFLGFEIVAPVTLRIEFNDATQRVIDFEAVLRGQLCGPLRGCDYSLPEVC